MGTYVGQSPEMIRTGDEVTDGLGRTFVADSDAVLDMGDFQVLSDGKWLTLDAKSLVTITYDEQAWNDWETESLTA
jgi:hypothetical protein